MLLYKWIWLEKLVVTKQVTSLNTFILDSFQPNITDKSAICIIVILFHLGKHKSVILLQKNRFHNIWFTIPPTALIINRINMKMDQLLGLNSIWAQNLTVIYLTPKYNTDLFVLIQSRCLGKTTWMLAYRHKLMPKCHISKNQNWQWLAENPNWVRFLCLCGLWSQKHFRSSPLVLCSHYNRRPCAKFTLKYNHQVAGNCELWLSLSHSGTDTGFTHPTSQETMQTQ